MTFPQAQLVQTIKAHIARGDKAADKAEQHYIAAGQHLKTLKAQHKGNWAEWEELLKTKIGIGKSRASELMLIADGTKSVAQLRSEKAESMRSLRAQPSPPRGGEIELPRVSISQPDSDGRIEVTITSNVRPCGCRAQCTHCGTEYDFTVSYRCATADSALELVRAYTDPEIREMMQECRRAFQHDFENMQALAQWLLDHPQYTASVVAGWLECDEDRIDDLRRWAKNGFDKTEMPL